MHAPALVALVAAAGLASGAPAPAADTGGGVDARVGALMMVGFRGPVTARVTDSFARHRFGAVLLVNDNANADDAQSTRAAIAKLRAASPGLFVATDHEGGGVCYEAGGPLCTASARIAGAAGAPAAPAIGGDMKKMAADLKGLGFDIDLAPVADVYDGAHTFMKQRSYGTDPAAVAAIVEAAVKGIHAGGLLACAKHFPGHGAADGDSHKLLPRVSLDEATLVARDWLPFRAAVGAGVDMIMVGHLDVPALDRALPSSVSPAVLARVRTEFRFDGVIISDDLQMRGVEASFGVPEAAVRFLAAGGDMVIVAHDLEVAERVHVALVRALKGGAYPRARVDASFARVEKMRARLRR